MVTLSLTASARSLPVIGGRRFSPAALFAAGEVGAWYDPSDLSTLYQDDALTIPATSVDDPVGGIRDKSGRGNHAKQSTPTARPLLKQDANGRYYLQFDGTDDFLSTENIAWPGQYSAWAGVNVSTNGSIQCIIDGDPGAGTRTPQYLRVSSTTPQSIAFASGDFTDSGSAITSGTNVMLSAFATTTTLDVRNNGASNGTTAISGTLASASTPLYLGRYAGSATAFMNARLYAAVVRGAASTAAEISSTDGWVNSKTGAY